MNTHTLTIQNVHLTINTVFQLQINIWLLFKCWSGSRQLVWIHKL